MGVCASLVVTQALAIFDGSGEEDLADQDDMGKMVKAIVGAEGATGGRTGASMPLLQASFDLRPSGPMSVSLSDQFARQVELFARGDDETNMTPHPISGLTTCLLRPAPWTTDAATLTPALNSLSNRMPLPQVGVDAVAKLSGLSGLGLQERRERLLGPWDAVKAMIYGLQGHFDTEDGPVSDAAAVRDFPLPSDSGQVLAWWTGDDQSYIEGGCGLASLVAVEPRIADTGAVDSGGGGAVFRFRIERRLTVGGLRYLRDMAQARVWRALQRIGGDGGTAVSGMADAGGHSTAVRSVWEYCAAMESRWYPRGLPRSDLSAGAGTGDHLPGTDERVPPPAGAGGPGVALWPFVFWLMRCGLWSDVESVFRRYADSRPAAQRSAPVALAEAAQAVGTIVTFALLDVNDADMRNVGRARAMYREAYDDASAPKGHHANEHCPFRLAVLNVLGLENPDWQSLVDELDPFDKLSDLLWLKLIFAAARPLAAKVAPSDEIVRKMDLRALAADTVRELQTWVDDEDELDDEEDEEEDGAGAGASSTAAGRLATRGRVEDDAYFFATSLLLLQRFEWAIAVLALHGHPTNPVSHAEDAVHLALALHTAGLLRAPPSALVARADRAGSAANPHATHASSSAGAAAASSLGSPTADGGLTYAAGALLLRRLRSESAEAGPGGTFGGSLLSAEEARNVDASCRGDVATVDYLCIERLLRAHLRQRLGAKLSIGEASGTAWALPAGCGGEAVAPVAQRAAAYACVLQGRDTAATRHELLVGLLGCPAAADALVGELPYARAASSMPLSSFSSSSSLSAASSGARGGAGSGVAAFLPLRSPFLVSSGMLGSEAELHRPLLDAARDCVAAVMPVEAVDLFARASAVGDAASLLLTSLTEHMAPSRDSTRRDLLHRARVLSSMKRPTAAHNARDAAVVAAFESDRDEYGASLSTRLDSLQLLLRIAAVVDTCHRMAYAESVRMAFQETPGPPLLPRLRRRAHSGMDSTDAWLAFEEAHPSIRPAFSILMLVVAVALKEMQKEGSADAETMQQVRALRVTSHADFVLQANFAEKVSEMLR